MLVESGMVLTFELEIEVTSPLIITAGLSQAWTCMDLSPLLNA